MLVVLGRDLVQIGLGVGLERQTTGATEQLPRRPTRDGTVGVLEETIE
jgi:hypothetical protein